MMSARIGFVYFLTALMGGLLYLLILHPVTLSQDARAIIETVLGGLTPILMHVITSTFPSHSTVPPSGPTPPVEPASTKVTS
jgi:hypothetical protein